MVELRKDGKRRSFESFDQIGAYVNERSETESLLYLKTSNINYLYVARNIILLLIWKLYMVQKQNTLRNYFNTTLVFLRFYVGYFGCVEKLTMGIWICKNRSSEIFSLFKRLFKSKVKFGKTTCKCEFHFSNKNPKM